MKKITAILLLVTLSFGALSFQPKRSDAFVAGIVALTGPAAGALPWLVLGGISETAGLSIGVFADGGSEKAAFYAIGAIALVGLGIFLLDGNEGSADVAFLKLSNADAKQLHISAVDKTVYNSELEELNAVREAVMQDTIAHGYSLRTKGEVLGFIRRSWDAQKNRMELSTATLRVAEQIVQSFVLSNRTTAAKQMQ